MQMIAAVAGIVAADPPCLPSQTRTPETTAVQASRISYFWWAAYPTFVVPILAIAFWFLAVATEVISFDGQEDSEVEETLGLILLGLLCLAAGIGVGRAGLNRLKEITKGYTRLVGTLDRKWAAVSYTPKPAEYSVDSRKPDLFYIRVEGLPFLVKESQYRALPEGQTVEVAYWPKDKRVASLHAKTTKHG